MRQYEINPPIYEMFIENIKYIYTNIMLENGPMYLY